MSHDSGLVWTLKSPSQRDRSSPTFKHISSDVSPSRSASTLTLTTQLWTWRPDTGRSSSTSRASPPTGGSWSRCSGSSSSSSSSSSFSWPEDRRYWTDEWEKRNGKKDVKNVIGLKARLCYEKWLSMLDKWRGKAGCGWNAVSLTKWPPGWYRNCFDPWNDIRSRGKKKLGHLLTQEEIRTWTFFQDQGFHWAILSYEESMCMLP